MPSRARTGWRSRPSFGRCEGEAVTFLDRVEADPAEFLPQFVAMLTAVKLDDDWKALDQVIKDAGGPYQALVLTLSTVEGMFVGIAEAAGLSIEEFLQRVSTYRP